MKKLPIFLAALFMAATGACSKAEKRVPQSNRVAESILAPALLLDKEEIAKYVSDFPHADYQIFDVAGIGKFYLDDNPALVKKQLRAGKPWEPEALELFSKYAVPGSTALDIGAHIGSLTLPLARSVGPDGIVYAFEPQKKIYRELVKNLELNSVNNAVPLRFAVGAQHLVIEMTPTQGRDGTMQVGAGGDKAEMRSIDSFVFSNVSMMKIDVEGYELPVLKGARRTIRKWHPAILIEIPGFYHYKTLPAKQKEQIDGVRSFFEQNGYRLRFAYDAGEPHFFALYKQNQ